MPFWRKNDGRPSKGEIETMHDAKVSLAENLPAHVKIVDLSQIYMSELPYGILSIVKHQMKECLILKNNEIKDLKCDLEMLGDLKKLDISFNLLKSIPKGFASLQSLAHLNLDHNHLKSLPSVLGSLPNLETLSACSNVIISVAPEIGALRHLHSLLLKNNDITKIPDQFAHCYRLSNLEVDLEKLTYPPPEIVMKGGRATVLWLCEENNVDKTKVGGEESHVTALTEISAQERQAEEMMLRRQAHEDEEAATILAKIKEDEDRMRKVSENTNRLEENRRKKMQLLMANEERVETKKLSEYLNFMDDVKMHNIREALKEVEDKDIDAERILAEVTAMFEEEKLRLKEHIAEDEALLKEYVANHKLDMSFISTEMEKILAEEQMMAAFARNADTELHKMFNLVEEEGRQEVKLHNEMAASYEQDKGQMLKMILEDEELQRKMFITAQQEHDNVYKTLTSQIESVQENLMLLTILEKSQKELDSQVVSDIHGQRAEMAGLLTQLMEKQQERRVELEETAILLEEQYEDELANFWLYQYQMLMASKPAKILREEEEAIHAASKAAQIEKPDGDDSYPTPAVLPAAWNGEPSAPRKSVSEPTPPLRKQEPRSAVAAAAETECCICLDAAPSVAFLPCGHVCCCADCGIISVCPMCRAEITTAIKLYFTQS